MVYILPSTVGTCDHQVHCSHVHQGRRYGILVEVRIFDDGYLVGQDVGTKVLDVFGQDELAVLSQEILVVGQTAYLQSNADPIVLQFLGQVALSVARVGGKQV